MTSPLVATPAPVRSPSVLERAGLLLAMVLAGAAAGVGLGAVGMSRGPELMLALPAGAVVLLLVAWRSVAAVAAVPLLVLVGLRPVGGSGLQVVHALGVLAIVVVALRRPAAGALRPVGAPLVWALVLVLVALVSTLLSQDVAAGVRPDANLLLGVGLAFACVSVARSQRALLLLLRCSAVGSLLVTVPALLAVGPLQIAYGGAAVAGRLTGPFSEPNELGSYTVSAFWVCLALLASSRARVDRAMGGAGAVAAFVALAFSLSRGAWLGLVLGLVALLVLHPPAWRRVVACLSALAAAVALALAVAPPAQLGIVVDRLATITDGRANPDDRRDLIRAEARRQIERAPVLGTGPGSFALESARADSVVAQYRRLHAHNVLLQVGAETGLLGVAALLALTAAAAAAAVRSTRALRRARRPRQAVVVAALGAACASIAGHGIVDVTFLNPVIMVVGWLVLGLLLAAVAVHAPTAVPIRPAPTRPLPTRPLPTRPAPTPTTSTGGAPGRPTTRLRRPSAATVA